MRKNVVLGAVMALASFVSGSYGEDVPKMIACVNI
jgi:hypothetical protein